MIPSRFRSTLSSKKLTVTFRTLICPTFRTVTVTVMSVLIGCSRDAPLPPETLIDATLRSGVRLENVRPRTVSDMTSDDPGASGVYVVPSITADPCARYELLTVRVETVRDSENARYTMNPSGALTGHVGDEVK